LTTPSQEQIKLKASDSAPNLQCTAHCVHVFHTCWESRDISDVVAWCAVLLCWLGWGGPVLDLARLLCCSCPEPCCGAAGPGTDARHWHAADSIAL